MPSPTLDATGLAQQYVGDSIYSNIFLLGFTFQRGTIPLLAKPSRGHSS